MLLWKRPACRMLPEPVDDPTDPSENDPTMWPGYQRAREADSAARAATHAASLCTGDSFPRGKKAILAPIPRRFLLATLHLFCETHRGQNVDLTASEKEETSARCVAIVWRCSDKRWPSPGSGVSNMVMGHAKSSPFPLA